MAFVQGPKSFYAVRFLLGIAEAGFFPGIIFYLTCWFPSQHRARIIALVHDRVATVERHRRADFDLAARYRRRRICTAGNGCF